MDEAERRGWILVEQTAANVQLLLEGFSQIPVINERLSRLEAAFLPVPADLAALKAIAHEHSDILHQHSGQLTEINKTLGEHSQILTEHSQILTEHSQILTEHSQILGEHSRILGEHSEVLGEHSLQLQEIKSELGEVKQLGLRHDSQVADLKAASHVH